MTLDEALMILARCHTRDDPQQAGYLVESLPTTYWNGVSQADYVKAWGVVRHYLHMPVDPPEDRP